jgi:hypothetical protein
MLTKIAVPSITLYYKQNIYSIANDATSKTQAFS